MLLSEVIETTFIKQDGNFKNLGQCIVEQPELLTFIDDMKFLESLLENKSISCIITNEQIYCELKKNSNIFFKKIGIVVTENPRYEFFKLHNRLKLSTLTIRDNEISRKSNISKNAIIQGNNIKIEDDVIIEDFAIIKDNVHIKKGAIIRNYCVVGGEGFEFKKEKDKILRVKHFGGVIIGENVEIKEYVTVHKAVFNWDNTIIGKNTQIDAHSHIAHGVKLGKMVLIGSHSNLAGNINVEDYSYIGPGSTLSNRITVNYGTKISLGSVVTKDTAPNSHISGNFAIDHNKFIEHIKEIRE